jgi:hypothetical protein
VNIWRIHMPLTGSGVLQVSLVTVSFHRADLVVCSGSFYIFRAFPPLKGMIILIIISLLLQFSVIFSWSGGPREVGSEVCLRELMHLHGWVVSRDSASAWCVDAILPFLHFLQYWVHFLNLIHPRTLPGIGKDGTADMNFVRTKAEINYYLFPHWST